MTNIKNKVFFGTLFLFILLSTFSVFADVGVGISPSKMDYSVESGQSLTFDLLVFNTGTSSMQINLAPSPEIAKYVTIVPSSAVIDPEPTPHSLPIKNGKTFKVTITAPSVYSVQQYAGQISATGSPTSGSTFGGSVGVVAGLQFTVTPKPSIFAALQNIPMTQLVIIVVVILLIVLFFVLRKMGLKIRFEK